MALIKENNELKINHKKWRKKEKSFLYSS